MAKYKLTRNQAEQCISRIRTAIQKYFKDNNLTYAVFGKSEGLDSSVIAGLLSKLDGIKPIGLLMPCESNPETERIGRLVLDHYEIPSIRIDLTAEYHSIVASFNSSGSVQDQLIQIAKDYNDHHLFHDIAKRKSRAAGNIKARLRMISLYHVAQLTGGIVISTDNLSELWMGFWTLNGDVGDLSPVQFIWKGLELYTIAETLGVPKESLDVAPTDGLDVIPGSTDEDQLGLPYHELDLVIIRLLQNKFDGTIGWQEEKKKRLFESIATKNGFSSEAVAHVANQLTITHYKRNWPKVFTRKDIYLPEIDNIEL